MATGTIKNNGWATVFYNTTSNLTKDKTNANQIDLSTAIAENCPSGFSFDHIEFLGGWPGSAWANAGVFRVYNTDIPATTLQLNCLSSQSYSLSMCFWYKK